MRYLIVLLLTGCALTPQEMREEGHRYTHSSPKPPREAAACMGRAMEEHYPAGQWVSRWREGLKPGAVELLAGPASDSVVVVDLTPTSSGSSATIHVRPFLLPAIRNGAVEALKGC